MNQKQIGMVLLVIGVAFSLFVFNSKVREDYNIDLIIGAQNGSCYLADGTCLHEDRDFTFFIMGGVISGALILLGLYLVLIDKTQVALAAHQVMVSKALNEAKSKDKKVKEFEAFLAGFSDDEKKVLNVVHKEEGVEQSTLRYKTSMSKTALSLLLADLEKRKIVSRKKKGKTNQIFLVKKY